VTGHKTNNNINKKTNTERQNKDFEIDAIFESSEHFQHDDISVEQESQDDIYTTVNYMNTIHG